MRLFEFSDRQLQTDFWVLVNDNLWKAISAKTQEQERIDQQDQQKQKKMPKKSQSRKTAPKPPKLAKPSKPKVIAPPTSKTIKKQQPPINREKERKNTSRSLPQTTSQPKTSVASAQAQNTLQTRTRLPLHDPNSVANTERKLYPLANDGVVKRLTS